MHAHKIEGFGARIGETQSDRLDRLVDDLIDLQAEGDATRQRLLERGWPAAFLDANETEMRGRANARFVRSVTADPYKSLVSVQDEMTEIICSLLPATQFVVAELQARGFSKRNIDLLLHKARAKAALSFAHGTIREVN